MLQDASEILVGHDDDGTIAQVRNALGERAKGTHLLFLDADDELAPDFLGAMRRAWERAEGADGTPRSLAPPDIKSKNSAWSGTARSGTEWRGVAGQGVPPLLTPQVSYVRKGRPMRARFLDRGISLRDDNWLVVGTLVRKDLFIRVGGFSDYEHGFEDWSCWNKCWRMGAEIIKVPDAIYYAHMNPRSKHRAAWRNRQWQVATHMRIAAELDEWAQANCPGVRI